MKVCAMCNTEVEDEVTNCPSCGSEDFSFKCYNCGEIYDSGFCPNCGVEAGNKGKMCPNCNKLYFGRSCQDCGYREISANATKKYTMSAEAVEKAKAGLDESQNPTVGLNEKNLSPEAIALAQMAMNRTAGAPLNFSMFKPTVSDKTRAMAIVLCLLFGWLGLHQFYVGNTKKGVLYASTMGLFGVGIIFDLYRIFDGSFTDKNGLPLKQ